MEIVPISLGEIYKLVIKSKGEKFDMLKRYPK